MFDRMANVKKPTGHASFSLEVRRAKNIARDILERVNVISVSDKDGDETDEGERNVLSCEGERTE